MNLDMYIHKIEVIANKIANDYKYNEIRTFTEPYCLDEKMLDEFFEMVKIKKLMITSNERWQSEMVPNKKIDALDVDSETKILLTSIYHDVWKRSCEIMFLRSMEKYRDNNPIFKKNNLYEHVRHCNELIDFTVLNWDKLISTCEYGGSYFIPNGFLKEEIIEFTKNQFPFKKKYIRLDAYYCSEKRPPLLIGEEALRPVNPDWINKLRLFKGESTGGHYILQEPEISPGTKPSNIEGLKLWEYKVQGIRSLEVHAQRNNNGNISMMLEEIKDKPKYKKYFVAKCIHLDSDNPVGTSFETAVLNHIDLAINVYFKDVFLKRKNQSLVSGRVVDASLRTHLLRFDGVPFRTLINLSALFFDSEVLTREWIFDQFGG
ncbi:MAG: hypothetical protein GX941_09280 [Candidatus Methanofastidiosa archaeon]|nr:hypothetical protein [Candidatus Methanofastidiosa archaeon]NMA31977.1 hypothetical protein [Candidatus Methanofastidiosa archaeon]